MIQETYFHLAGQTLAPGSVIEPGNWGRIIRLCGWGHSLAIREMALEAARLARFRERPSRMECAFAFPSQMEAEQFRQVTSGFGAHVLYEVRLADKAAPQFGADTDRVNPVGDMRPDWADAYWSGIDPDAAKPITEGGVVRREVLTLSPLVIDRQL